MDQQTPDADARNSGDGVEELCLGKRAQTTLDFAIGITIFITIITFVFTLIPGALAPFTGGAQDETVAANRVADQLAEGALVTGNNSYVLDEDCTRKFFDNQTGGSCPYSGSTLNERVGLQDRASLNVTVIDMDGDAADDRLCWDDGNAETTDTTDSDCTPGANNDVVYQIGPTAPKDSGAVVTARRSVSVADSEGILLIRMW